MGDTQVLKSASATMTYWILTGEPEDRCDLRRRMTKAQEDVARAQLQARMIDVPRASVLAPNHGTISARTATPGSVAPVGQKLFRLIRQDRLQWQAEVTAAKWHRFVLDNLSRCYCRITRRRVARSRGLCRHWIRNLLSRSSMPTWV
jgi:hypothetical protein